MRAISRRCGSGSRVFLGDDFERAFFGFVEQVGQADGLAGAGFERLAVLAQDGAEPDVGQLGFGLRMPAAEGGEQLPEMELLAAVGDIDDFVRAPGFEPVGQRRQVGGGVVERRRRSSGRWAGWRPTRRPCG